MPKPRKKAKARFYRDEQRRFHWALILPNGTVIAQSPVDGEGYDSMSKCKARFLAFTKTIKAGEYVMVSDLDTPKAQAASA